MKRIVVTVASDGKVSAETVGITGPKCLDEMSTIRALIPNALVVDSRLTSDYYTTVKATEQQTDTTEDKNWEMR